MNVWSSVIYRKGIEAVLQWIDLECLQGKKILITGATGLVCSAIVDILICYNMKMDAAITIYVAGRNVNKLAERFSHGIKYGVIPVEYDATVGNCFDFFSDYVIHGASNSSPDKYINEPVDTMLANIIGIRDLLDYAKTCNSKKTVYISSSEVYGVLTHGKPLQEEEYGFIDILSDRASYPMGKRAAESLCISYANQYGLDVSIVRPGHIYGPTAQISDKRVSSLFSYQAVAGKPVVMKSAGSQIRSYCHCIDCATAILTVMMKGKNKEAYNVSNPESIISIRQMAELIAKYAEVELQMHLPDCDEKKAFNPMDNSSLNGQKLENLGWRYIYDANIGFEHTILVMKEFLA